MNEWLQGINILNHSARHWFVHPHIYIMISPDKEKTGQIHLAQTNMVLRTWTCFAFCCRFSFSVWITKKETPCLQRNVTGSWCYCQAAHTEHYRLTACGNVWSPFSPHPYPSSKTHTHTFKKHLLNMCYPLKSIPFYHQQCKIVSYYK